MLISTVIEGAHQQKYFAEHLPELTDVTKEKTPSLNFNNYTFQFYAFKSAWSNR